MPVNVEIKTRRGTAAEWASANPVLSDGEPGLETDTGVIKYGDGVSHWDELPAANKQFQNVVTVAKSGKRGTADFICSEYDSDDECIQAAINSAVTGIIHINEGDYYLSSDILKNGKNITLIGNGTVNFHIQNTTSGAHTLTFTGTSIAAPTLSTDANFHDIQLSVTDASLVHEGDLLKIWKNIQWCPLDYPTQMTGEMYAVKSVSGNVITLTEPLLRDYHLSDTVSIRTYRPIEVHLENIHFIDTDGTSTRSGIVLQYCKNSTIKDCWFSDIGTSSVSLYSCFNVICQRNHIKNSYNSVAGYGIAVWSGSAHIFIEKNEIQNCKHTVTGNSDEVRTLNRHVVLKDNTLVGGTITGANTIDSHPVTIDFTITHNKISTMLSGGVGFHDGTMISEFSYNDVYGGDIAVGKRGNLTECRHVVCNNNMYGVTTYGAVGAGYGDLLDIHDNIQNGGNFGIRFPSTTTEYYKRLVIKNNKFKNVVNQGLYILYNNSSMNVEISGNTAEEISNGGFYIEGKDTSNGVLHVTGNILNNVNLLSNYTYGSGIKLVNIFNSQISNNEISDSANLINNGIYEYTGCDYNKIFNNKISGYTDYGIRATGAHSKVKDNTGWTTEATGTATIATSGTSVIVTHGLAAAPTRVIVTPGSNVNCWVDPGSITATQFTISSTAPASDTTVYWSAVV